MGLKQRITNAVHGQTQPTVTVLSALLAVEDELRYIPKEAVEEVAAFCHATVNDVWAVASLFTAISGLSLPVSTRLSCVGVPPVIWSGQWP